MYLLTAAKAVTFINPRRIIAGKLFIKPGIVSQSAPNKTRALLREILIRAFLPPKRIARDNGLFNIENRLPLQLFTLRFIGK